MDAQEPSMILLEVLHFVTVVPVDTLIVNVGIATLSLAPAADPTISTWVRDQLRKPCCLPDSIEIWLVVYSSFVRSK